MIHSDEMIAEQIAHAGSLDDAEWLLRRFADRLDFELLHRAAELERALGPSSRPTLIRLLEARARTVSRKATFPAR